VAKIPKSQLQLPIKSKAKRAGKRRLKKLRAFP
jgi:hypothetical protein